MRKLTLLAGAAAGYVLGARAGRDRYEQIKRGALRVRSNPTVQDTARHAAEAAKGAAPVVKEKVADVASAAADKVKPSSDTLPQASGVGVGAPFTTPPTSSVPSPSSPSAPASATQPSSASESSTPSASSTTLSG